MWGQPHPWEFAKTTYDQWMAVLRFATQRHVETAKVVTDFYQTGGSIGLERLREMQETRELWQRRYRAVLDGNPDVVTELEELLTSESA